MNLRQVEIQIPAKNLLTSKGTVEVPPRTILGNFHCWEHYKDDEHSRVYAIVELEDGRVSRYETHEIKFTGLPPGSGIFEEGLSLED